MTESSLRVLRASNSKKERIDIEKQESSASHLKNLKYLRANKESLAVDPVSVQKSRSVLPGGRNLLIRYVVVETGSGSEQSNRYRPDPPARRFTSNTDSVNDSFVTLSKILVFGVNPLSFSVQSGSSHSKTCDTDPSLSSKSALLLENEDVIKTFLGLCSN